MLKSEKSVDHIPFVNNERDCEILRRLFADSEVVRIPLLGNERILASLPDGVKLWVDPWIDGLERWPDAAEKYINYIGNFPHSDLIADPSFQRKPDAGTVRAFVNSVLRACAAVGPDWISIPQLPISTDSGRNKINRQLADATRLWVAESRFAGRLILPIIFTHQSQINLKTARTPKLILMKDCFERAGAHGVWVVDSSLMDQLGARTLETTRLPGLVSLHQELIGHLPRDTFAVAGPYWGLNLVLWARGLARHPAIGLGNQFQYHLPGGKLLPAKSRIALESLKRWVVASQSLQNWLNTSLKTLSPLEPAHAELAGILARFSTFLRGPNREQVAAVYKSWFNSLAAVPPAGRALALYQQLSSAYVLGKGLPELPIEEGSARRPERVAQQLMMICL